MSDNATSWEHEIAECRKRVGDDSRVLAVTWWEVEEPLDLGVAARGGQPDVPLHQWKIGDDEDSLMKFLRRSPDPWSDEVWGSGFSGPFVAWTEKWVYFSVICDGFEWVNAVPSAPMPGFYPCYSGG